MQNRRQGSLFNKATRRIVQFCLLALPISSMTAFPTQPSFAQTIPYTISTQAVCTQVGTESNPNPPNPSATGWYVGLNREMDNKLISGDVVAYKIKWSDGSWSDWYVKGMNDLDAKYNPSNNTLRLMWSYFTDHKNLYIICRRP